MNFSWGILAMVELINLGCVMIMLEVQNSDRSLPRRHSIIPGTHQKFLYIQDFWTMTWGDVVGVPLFVNAFVHSIFLTHDNSNIWWALVSGMIVIVIFLKMCLGKNHKPDYGFPQAGKISLAGILHLIYMGVGFGAGITCLKNLVTGTLYGPVLWVALAGGVIWIWFFVLEIKSGNFDPIKRISELPEN